MLALGKKIDYALISLAYLAQRTARYVSAREIAAANSLPLPVLMQILKVLHNEGILKSTRGVKGGYQIGTDLEAVSLYAISEMLEWPEAGRDGQEIAAMRVEDYLPLRAMRQKLSEFLRRVRVSEVVSPGRRIDVPLGNLRIVDRLRTVKTS